MNRLDASLDAQGWLSAGPFVVRMPDAGPGPGAAGGQLVAGVRPEDVVLEERGDGVPARIESDIDLGHYRRVSLSVEGASLLAFVPKSELVPSDGITVRPTRVLLYADGHLAGVSEPVRPDAVST